MNIKATLRNSSRRPKVKDSVFTFTANGHRVEFTIDNDQALVVVDNEPSQKLGLAAALGEFFNKVGAFPKYSSDPAGEGLVERVSGAIDPENPAIEEHCGGSVGIEDALVDRTVNGKPVKAKEFTSSEEAAKFLQANKGYSMVDEDNGKVYVALNV